MEKERRLTQKDRILKYMKDFGYISSWDAYADLGITQLGARIYELKKIGYVFSKERIKTSNRYGQPVFFDLYKIEEAPV